MPLSYAPLQSVIDSTTVNSSVELSLLRLDLFSPLLSGNKYFKLKYNLQRAKKMGFKQIISFGGQYSNHIHALAQAGKETGLATIGLIRGEQQHVLNETLSDAVNCGMTLRFVSRSEYRQRNIPIYIESLKAEYPDAYFIPEGGSNILGVKGCMEIVDHINFHLKGDYDFIVLACGTAATLAGIAAATPEKKIIGFSVLKNATYLENSVSGYLKKMAVTGCNNWQILHGYHCGGYAKINVELANFIHRFVTYHEIPIEPVYTGKMLYGLYQILARGEIPVGSKVVAVHTGGLQGLRGMENLLARKLSSTM